jgi:hypothetical protein
MSDNTVCVALVNHKHGINTYAARSREGLYTKVLESFVKEWWEHEIPDTPMPEADAESIVDEYFETVGHETIDADFDVEIYTPPPEEPLRRMVCSKCGSERITRDADALWDMKLQDWVLGDVYDACGGCKDCGDNNASVKEEEVDHVDE